MRALLWKKHDQGSAAVRCLLANLKASLSLDSFFFQHDNPQKQSSFLRLRQRRHRAGRRQARRGTPTTAATI
jgi:hypothetical protein